MKTKLLWGAIVLVAAGAVISAAIPVLRGIGAGATTVPVYEVRRADFVRRIHADGNLRAVDATLLGPPPTVTRPLKIAWLAPDGTPVKTDEVVIRFDPTDLEDELREGRHEQATTDTQITQKSVRDEGNRKNLERDADIASQELDYASNFQSKDDTIFSRAEIIEAEIDTDLALRRKDHAEVASGIHHDLAETELDLLRIERRKSEMKIQLAEQGLQALEVRAPHDGIFVHKSFWGNRPEVGQMVWAGNPVAELPNLDRMEAYVYVLEADAGGLEVGLPATVTLDAHPEAAFTGSVKKVTALAQRRNRKSPIQYFGVTLELELTDPETMKPGQRVQAVLTVDEHQDVVTVPRQAVFEEDGKKIVYVSRGGRFEATEVELGPIALGRTVIESGIEPGDRIALRDPMRPVNGADTEDRKSEGGPVG